MGVNGRFRNRRAGVLAQCDPRSKCRELLVRGPWRPKLLAEMRQMVLQLPFSKAALVRGLPERIPLPDTGDLQARALTRPRHGVAVKFAFGRVNERVRCQNL